MRVPYVSGASTSETSVLWIGAVTEPKGGKLEARKASRGKLPAQELFPKEGSVSGEITLAGGADDKHNKRVLKQRALFGE